MKKALKIISTVSIILFAILLISSKFNFLDEFNSYDNQSILVVIYLFTSLKYFQMEAKDQEAKIEELQLKLKKAEMEI